MWNDIKDKFMDYKNLFSGIKKNPERYYLIHYSSQSLFDAEAGKHSPRITSIVVEHLASRQKVSFTIHTIAELMGVAPDDVESNYDQIELGLLEKFYEFVRDRRTNYWIHWNMRNIVYGFEHIEHRY
jgi:ribosomal protein L20A (L18A)